MKKLVSIIITLILILNIAYGAQAGIPTYQGTSSANATYINMSYTDIDKSFAKQDIMRMTALSVIRGGGDRKYYPANNVKREEALAMILRLMGREGDIQKAIPTGNGNPGQIAGQANNNPPTYIGTGTSQMVDSWAQGVISVATKTGLISKQETSLNFTQNATRQEIANWIAKGINLTPVYGKDTQFVYSYKDSDLFDSGNIPYIEATIESGIMSGYNNGKFGPNDSITREQMASVLSRAFNKAYAMMGYTKGEGYIENIIKDNVGGGTRITYILRNGNGQSENLVSEDSSYGKYDFTTLKSGIQGLSGALTIGDNITYYLNGSNVVFAETNSSQLSIISGTIDSISGNTFRLITDTGSSYVINYNANTTVTMNSVEASINDLKYGEFATVTMYGNVATKIDVEYTDYSKDGQVETGDRQDSGRIVSADLNGNSVNVTLDNGKAYTLSSDMPINGAGDTRSADSLKVGEYIKLYFSDIKSNTPDKVFVEDDYNKSIDVIRGDIAGVSGFNPKILLKNVERYKQGQWVSLTNYNKYGLDGATIYYDGGKITKDDINQYKGAKAYISLENHYGNDTASVVSIQSGFNMSYEGNIDYNNGTMSIMLNDGRKVGINDGTIILKDGLKVPPDILASVKQAYISFSRNGNANFISILDSQESPEYYYAKAMIKSVTADSLTIGDTYYYGYYNVYGYKTIKNNEWSLNSGDETFFIGGTTYIVDNTGDNPVQVQYDEFLKQKYGIKDYYSVYVVANGKNAIAINIRPLSESDRVSEAVINSINGNMISIDNVKDWNGLNDKWDLNTSIDTIDATKAVIVKNNRRITIDDLRNGDNLYIIRDGVNGIIIAVK
ncbi:S-layer homology domain-containing protein [Thermoanaerobacterium sp. RBIITD]|uniref:S-layer homology domain-containing protein n=1 Tax=Thermoanaerobacterium sp. RBIITD TaxID=1550240 RepID=UPI000BB9300E|nr:S-layer homology domain-containing protein [Thermoanaerobacterium sp. RBIITD]SNX53541.1 S-layer homology domain-containing protein [Thermoanaerobacterium sp. RBIITD]